MGHKNTAGAKPIIQLREKRKFNWLVLLLVVVAVNAAWLLT
jgi:hypothetical protein